MEDQKSKLVQNVQVILYGIMGGISLLLLIATLAVIAITLFGLFTPDTLLGDTKTAISTILYVLILLELVVILKHYFEYHHISVTRIVELGVIAVVREVIFHLLDWEWAQILAVSALLLVLGAMYLVRKMLPYDNMPD